MTLFVSELINGLSLASFFALVSGGLALIFGVVGIVNFAHGDFVMVSGYLFYEFYTQAKLPYLLAIVLTVVVACALAAVIYLFAIAHLIAIAAFSALADTSSSVRKVSAGGCYCGCSHAKTSAGCGKMCDLPKYASRWWAVTCAKPRSKTPAENPGAGPHFAHQPKAERASN